MRDMNLNSGRIANCHHRLTVASTLAIVFALQRHGLLGGVSQDAWSFYSQGSVSLKR